MKERRSLIEGLKVTPEVQELEESFVYGTSRKQELRPMEVETAPPVELPKQMSETPAIVEQQPRVLPQMTGRVPITTRARPEVATALKRASLQRQLAGAEPYHVQDIVEEALENWLNSKGYVQ
jgi:hypothetical protein